MPESLEKSLQEIRAIICSEIEKYVVVKQDSLIPFQESLLYSCLATGKMIRPFLCLSWGEILGAKRDDCLRLATAIELIHVYSLIHDDLPSMDDDDIRRGKPTLHKQYNEATAILAGDGLQSLAFEIIADIKSKELALILKAFAKAIGINGMVGGQYLDINFENKTNISKEDVTFMQNLKTGKLIEFSCQAPFLLTKQPQEINIIIEKYSKHLGLIFQVRDDFLDKWGDPLEMGKKNKKDQEKGKPTLLAGMTQTEAEEFLLQLQTQSLAILKQFPQKYQSSKIEEFTKYIIKRGK